MAMVKAMVAPRDMVTSMNMLMMAKENKIKLAETITPLVTGVITVFPQEF